MYSVDLNERTRSESENESESTECKFLMALIGSVGFGFGKPKRRSWRRKVRGRIR